MGLSRLSEQCRKCRYANTCQHKRMEAVAVMAQASMPSAESAAMPALVKHDYRNVKITENTTVTIDLEEMKENMRKSFYKGFLRSAT
ncbi:hypothetical protein ACVS9P_02505 [Caproicibacterium sp. NSD3]